MNFLHGAVWFEPWLWHCIVLLGKGFTLSSPSLYPYVSGGTGKLMLGEGVKPAID